jgi:hypothetical protein
VRSKIREELAARIARLKVLRLWVSQIAIVLSVGIEKRRVSVVPECLGQPGDRVIGIAIRHARHDRPLQRHTTKRKRCEMP